MLRHRTSLPQAAAADAGVEQSKMDWCDVLDIRLPRRLVSLEAEGHSWTIERRFA